MTAITHLFLVFYPHTDSPQSLVTRSTQEFYCTQLLNLKHHRPGTYLKTLGFRKNRNLVRTLLLERMRANTSYYRDLVQKLKAQLLTEE